jgi:hypothetical protein
MNTKRGAAIDAEAPSGGVTWTPEDEARLDEALAKRAASRAARGGESERYCLGCQKLGHRTEECHSTHGLNTPEARELFRLVRIAHGVPPSPDGPPVPVTAREAAYWIGKGE